MGLGPLEKSSKGWYSGFVVQEDKRRWYMDKSGLSGLLVAPTGLGKGTKILMFNGLVSAGCSLVWNCPKLETHAVVARQQRALGKKTYVLNPFGTCEDWPHEDLTTNRFNPVAAGPGPHDRGFENYCNALAEGIWINTGGDKFFTNGARILGAGVTGFARGLSPENQSLRTVYDILKSRGEDLLIFMREMRDSGIEIARAAAAPYLVAEPTRGAMEILETAAQQITWAGVPEIQSVIDGPSDFTYDEIKRGNVLVTIGIPEAESKMYPSLTRMFFAAILKACLTPPLYAPVRLVIDEAGVCLAEQSLSTLETAYSLGRGSLTTVLSCFQNIPQARSVFGEKKFSSMMSACGTQVYMTPNDSETCAYLSNRCGERTALNLAYDGYRWKPTGGAIGVPVLRPHELYGFSRDRLLIVEQGRSNVIQAYALPYHKVPLLNDVANLNPYWEAKKAAGVA